LPAVVSKYQIITLSFLQTLNNYFYFFFIISLILSSCCQEDSQFLPKNGDLLFQDLDSSPLCDAIELVTIGYEGKHFSHVGIVTIKNNKHYVLEAFANGVDTIPLSIFLNRSVNKKNKPKIIVGRLNEEHSQIIENALKIGLNLVGLQYDEEFKINNNKYYCSELIYEIFFLANNKKPLFELEPMTYKLNNKTLDIWVDYFEKLNIDIPENEPGINPGAISLSNKINIIYNYEM